MGTWIKCPLCIKNLPKKYKNRKERKEVFVATCDACEFKLAQKSYEDGVKKGIWLKKWKKAANSFKKTVEVFGSLGDTKSMLICDLMYSLSLIRANKGVDSIKLLIEQMNSGKFDSFLNTNFSIPQFCDFDPLYHECLAWITFLQASTTSDMHRKTTLMKKASNQFFNIGYVPLNLSLFIENKKLTNIKKALIIEAEIERELGMYYAERDEIDDASFHLNIAAISFTNLEDHNTARNLKTFRKSLRMERACWICGTRSKGYPNRFRYKYTRCGESEHEKIAALLRQRQDLNPGIYRDTIYSTEEPVRAIEEVDRRDAGIYVTICKVCAGTLDQMAQDIVDAALVPVWKAIHQMSDQISALHAQVQSLVSAVQSLQAYSHSHPN